MSKITYRNLRQDNKREPYSHKHFTFANYLKWNRYWNRVDRVDRRLFNRVRSRFWREMVTGMYGDDLQQAIERFEENYELSITNPKKAIRRKK